MFFCSLKFQFENLNFFVISLESWAVDATLRLWAANTQRGSLWASWGAIGFSWGKRFSVWGIHWRQRSSLDLLALNELIDDPL